MNTIRYITAAVLIGLTAALTACGGGGGGGGDDGSSDSTSAPAQIATVEPLSEHRLRVTYEEAPTGQALNPANYAIIDGAGNPLDIFTITPLEGTNQVLIATEAQGTKGYTLVYPVSKGESPDPRDGTAFTGSATQEPALIDVEVLDLKHLRLTFSRPMDRQATTPTFYTIFRPRSGVARSAEAQSGRSAQPGKVEHRIMRARTVAVEARVSAHRRAMAVASEPADTVQILDAEFGPTATVVILTTETMVEPLEYVLMVGNIRGQDGIYLDPTRNTAQFNSDITPPRLLNVERQGDTILLLTFSEPLGTSAEDTANYILDPQATAVLDALVVGNGSQVVLTTEPLFDARYELTVSNVRDLRQGLLIDPTTRIMTFTGGDVLNAASPRVVAAVSSDNKTVIVQFSKPMGDNATNPAAYTIRPAGPGGDNLPVASAAFVDTTRLTVALTTHTQQVISYQVTVLGVTDLGGRPLASNNQDIDPSRATFVGTAPPPSEDVTPPRLLSAAPQGDTKLLLTFSEAVNETAEAPGNYAISLDTDVLSAQRSADNTQVVLETGPLFATEYHLTASNIEDLQGLLIDPAGKTVAFIGGDGSANSDRPRVVSAASTGNTTAIVGFSKAMADNALNPASYSIVQENVNPEVGFVAVQAAEFVSDSRLEIRLTTAPQNEVTYRVKVSGVTDLGGRPLASQERGVDPTSALFAGTPPSGDQLVDSDGDGVSDNRETLGYTVTLSLADGSTETVQVTSDPNDPDTDDDGLGDATERANGANPRIGDSDGDGLSDDLEFNTMFSSMNKRDSDGDSISDAFEHQTLKTSPILADTDGDRFSDDQELFSLNRDPLVADIPEVEITVGEVRLQLDERYSFTDETGETVTRESSTSSTLVRSEDTSFAESDSSTTEITAGGKVGFEAGNNAAFGADGTGFAAKVTGEINFQHKQSDTYATTSTSAQASQEAYQNSLNKGRQFTTTSAVSREVVGARIDVDLSIANTGSIAFTVSNLEVTVLQPSPIDRQRLVPVATLVANSQLITGTPLQINLGPSNPEAGPFLFASKDVFPNLVEALMANPRGLVFRVANYDLTDEFGRNFVFASQTTGDRTASITIDYGDAAAAETFLVATNGVLDEANLAGGGYLGGFDGSGRSRGLPLDYVLQARLGFTKHDQAQDFVDPGPNGSLDTIPADDDTIETLDGVEVIKPGPDGLLQSASVLAVDDFVSNPVQPNGIVAGTDQDADSLAVGDDRQLVPLGTEGVSVGTVVISAGNDGVLDTPTQEGDFRDFVSGYETLPTCSVESNKVGDTCRIDRDCMCAAGDADPRCNALDGPPPGQCTGPRRLARINGLRNGDFNRSWVVLTTGKVPAAADFGEILASADTNLSIAFVQDLDRDGIFARNEYLAGSTDSAADRLDNNRFGTDFDFDNPVLMPDGRADSRDTDRDGLGDFAEIRVGWMVGVDGGPLHQVYPSPTLRDSDGDGLLDPEEQNVSGYCQTTHGDFSLCANFPPSPSVEQGDAVAILAGPDGAADSVAKDTNHDGVVDARDDPSDDVQRVLDANDGGSRAVIVTAGPNGKIETDLALDGDDIYIDLGYVPPALDPTNADTDLDRVTDTDELQGYDYGLAIVDGPGDAGNDGKDIANTKAAATDVQKTAPGNPVVNEGIVVLPGPDGTLETQPVTGDVLHDSSMALTNPVDRDTDDDSILEGLEVALGSDPTEPDGNEFRDNDRDGLSNADEESLGWRVTANITSTTVLSNRSVPDTDADGLPDLIEREIRTNPNNADTDGDGLTDFDEVDDFERFVRLAAPYPVLNIQGGTSARYGTDPHKRDTDGDGLTDFHELIECDRIVLPGANSPSRICTSPVQKDTDLDGLGDDQELKRADGATDPTNRDTDGDGRSDGAEVSSVSDPLIPDVAVRVIVRHITADHQCGEAGPSPDGELVWWFVLYPPNGADAVLLSDALDAELLEPPESGAKLARESENYEGGFRSEVSIPDDRLHDAPRACFYKSLVSGQTYILNFNKVAATFAMKQGESFRFQGFIAEYDEGDGVSEDCGLEPHYIPSNIEVDAGGLVDQSYFYGDLANTTGFTITGDDEDVDFTSSDKCIVNYKIDFEVVGGSLDGG